MPISSKLPLKKINTVHNLITFLLVSEIKMVHLDLVKSFNQSSVQIFYRQPSGRNKNYAFRLSKIVRPILSSDILQATIK